MKNLTYYSVRFFGLALFFAALNCSASTIEERVVGVVNSDSITKYHMGLTRVKFPTNHIGTGARIEPCSRSETN
jgi:hypothetical protein